MKLKKMIAAGLIATMPFALSACAEDEDGDGVNTDEEIEQMDETVDSVGEEMEEEVTQTTAAN
jgi:hypothetical protein